MRTPSRFCRIVELVLAVSVAGVAGSCGTPSAGGGGAGGAEGRAAAGAFAFWPPAPNEPRVQFVKSFQSMYDVSRREASALERVVFGKEVEDAATIAKPYGVAMGNGKIYVCDIRNRSLTVMDLRKKQTRLVGVTGQNRVRHPVAVALGPDGSIYVGDNELNAVVVFDKDERFTRAIEMERLKPAGLAVHNNLLYVTNTLSQLVEVFDATTGAHLRSIGSVGDADGQFRLPLGVAVDAEGFVYVADMMRCRVQKFTAEGTFDEPHTFVDPFGVVLTRRNITPGSVLVTDLAHFPYINGVDYTVSYFPDRAEIQRLPFGSIANGQTVLVTYTIAPEPSNTIDTTSGTLSLRYTLTEGLFTGLSAYTTWIKTNQSVDAVDPSQFVLDDVTDWRYGLEYRRENLTLQVEWQDYDSTISPYDQLHLLARWDSRYSRLAALAMEVTYDDVNYSLTGNHVNLVRIISRWTQELDHGLSLMVYLQYRDENSTFNGDVRGFEWEVSLNWRLRQTNMYATYHSTMLNGPLQDGLNQSLMVGLTRTF